MSAPATTTLFRPVGQPELDLIAAAGFRAFPPRLSWQPIFYPVLSEEYAIQIARDWNTKDAQNGSVGYVTRFDVDRAYLERFAVQRVGGSEHLELWVPAEELPRFNEHIVGLIQVTRKFPVIATAAAGEKLAVLMEGAEFLRREAALGSRADFERVLAKAPDVPPEPRDTLD